MTLEHGIRVSVRTAIGAGCAYETFALSTRKVPTLSSLCRHHKLFETFLLAGLVAHFHFERQILDVLVREKETPIG